MRSKTPKTVRFAQALGVSSLVGTVFVALKLAGDLSWRWTWVTLPFWLGPAILLTAGFLVFLLAVPLIIYDRLRARRELLERYRNDSF